MTPGELDGTGDRAAGLSQDLPRRQGPGRHVHQTTRAHVTGLHVGFVKRGNMGHPSPCSRAWGEGPVEGELTPSALI